MKSTLQFDDIIVVPGLLLLLWMVQRSHMWSRKPSGRRPGNEATLKPVSTGSQSALQQLHLINTSPGCKKWPVYYINSEELTELNLCLSPLPSSTETIYSCCFISCEAGLGQSRNRSDKVLFVQWGWKMSVHTTNLHIYTDLENLKPSSWQIKLKRPHWNLHARNPHAGNLEHSSTLLSVTAMYVQMS